MNSIKVFVEIGKKRVFAVKPGMCLITPGKLMTELCDMMRSRITRKKFEKSSTSGSEYMSGSNYTSLAKCMRTPKGRNGSRQ